LRAYDIILKKRNGHTLAPAEIDFLIQGYTRGDIPDYQMAAWAMAVYFQGLNARETRALTRALEYSGEHVDLSGIPGIKVDKHSTGGVGDTTTLVLVPLVAAAGVPVAKMSGRGLGHTGGTLDKLESIPGFRVELSVQEMIDQVKEIGLAVIAQSANLVPADKKLYALRDVTATVDSMPLIAGSVMSKKLASGCQAIVLDVKCGRGAFMPELDAAVELARLMVDIGNDLERQTMALISQMEEPLGLAVGNALEVAEAISTLKGAGPHDLEELCLELGSLMLLAAGRVRERFEAVELLRRLLKSGAALDKFAKMIAAQGGDPRVIDNPGLLPKASCVLPVRALQNGIVREIDALEAGLAAMIAGAGRAAKEDGIDPAAGVLFKLKTGSAAARGDVLAEVYSNSPAKAAEAAGRLEKAIVIAGQAGPEQKLILGRVDQSGFQPA